MFINFLLAALAGALVPIQAGINAQLRSYAGSPWYATLTSVLVSTLAMCTFCLVTRTPFPSLAAMAKMPWWGWTGGLVGAVFVCLILTLAPKLGATALIATVITGQLLCSIILDQFAWLGFTQQSITLNRVIGIVLLAAGVFFISKH